MPTISSNMPNQKSILHDKFNSLLCTWTQLEKEFCVNYHQNKVNFSLPLRKRLAKQNVLQQLSFETTASWVLNKILEV